MVYAKGKSVFELIDPDGHVLQAHDAQFPIESLAKLGEQKGALAGLDHAVQQVRSRRRLAGQTPEVPSGLLDLVERYHATAEALDECGRLLGTLEIQRTPCSRRG